MMYNIRVVRSNADHISKRLTEHRAKRESASTCAAGLTAASDFRLHRADCGSPQEIRARDEMRTWGRLLNIQTTRNTLKDNQKKTTEYDQLKFTTLDLIQDCITIGRSGRSELLVTALNNRSDGKSHSNISGTHCKLHCRTTQNVTSAVLIDISKHGTWVNAERVAHQVEFQINDGGTACGDGDPMATCGPAGCSRIQVPLQRGSSKLPRPSLA